MAVDLSDVPTPTLERALELIASGRLVPPLTGFQLNAHGLAALGGAGLGDLGLDGVTSVIAAVIAERRRIVGQEAELVWTGPETKVSGARDTAVVLRELFANARKSVLIAGFRFDHGKTLLEPLHAVMRDHRVACSIFADRSEAEAFIGREWPFGPPFPEVYFDGRGEQFSSVHAKCVVVDEQEVLVTSANFTDRGQRRNVEVGVLLSDRGFAERLTRQWNSLISAGTFVQAGVPG